MAATAAASAMKCQTKGCVYFAMPDDVYCRNHRVKPPEIPQVPKAPEFEIIKLSSVPQFKIKNERAYNIARAVATLSHENALKTRCDDGRKLASAVCQMGTKLGVKVKYRSQPGVVYFWKVDAKKEKA